MLELVEFCMDGSDSMQFGPDAPPQFKTWEGGILDTLVSNSILGSITLTSFEVELL